MIDIKHLLNKGIDILQREDSERKQQTVGMYHVSSGGLWLEDKQTTCGKCHRQALARFLGVEPKIPFNRFVMFMGGHVNENLWVDIMQRAWPGTFKREQDIPVRSKTEKGTDIVGTPDLVLFNVDEKNSVPLKGLELKHMSTMYTVRDVYLDGVAKVEHLVQAAHYSEMLGVPFELWYTATSEYHLPDWLAKRYDANKYEFVEKNARGIIKKTNSVFVGFTLGFDGDALAYKSTEAGMLAAGTKTIITKRRMNDFFNFLDHMRETKDLGPRPLNVDANGKDLTWDKCDPMYCPYAGICNVHERNFDKWVEEASKLTAK